MATTITRVMSPATWFNKAKTNINNVGQTNYTNGVQNPKKDTIAAGVAAEQQWANAMQQAIQNKTRATELAKVTLSQWSDAAVTIGAPRLVPGWNAKQAKFQAFVNAWQPALQNQLTSVIDAMPSATAGDRNQKMIAMVEWLRSQRGQY